VVSEAYAKKSIGRKQPNIDMPTCYTERDGKFLPVKRPPLSAGREVEREIVRELAQEGNQRKEKEW